MDKNKANIILDNEQIADVLGGIGSPVSRMFNSLLVAGVLITCGIGITPGFSNQNLVYSKPVDASITTIPSNIVITYGQYLRDITLSYGWTWVYPNTKPNAGAHEYLADYYYSDGTYGGRYNIIVQVNKSEPQIPSCEATYFPDMRLRDIKLPNGWSWKWPFTYVGSSGSHYFEAEYYSSDSNYKSLSSVNVLVKVNKAEPVVPNVMTTYSQNKILADVKLPAGWSWINSYKKIEAGKHYCKARYAGDSNHKSGGFVITLVVEPALPTVPSFSFTYEPNKVTYLYDIQLPYGWHWCNPNEYVSSAGIYNCKANYISYDPNYKSATSVSIKIEVVKARPINIFFPQATSMCYGQNLGSSQLFGGIGNGVFKWSYENAIPDVCNEGYEVTFYPNNQNYHAISRIIPLVVYKNYIPSSAPGAPILTKKTDKTIEVNSKYGQEYSIDGGLTWQKSGLFTQLLQNTTYQIITRDYDCSNKVASESSASLIVTTKLSSVDYPKGLKAVKLVSRTNTSIELEKKDNLEYSIDGGSKWFDNKIGNLNPSTKYPVITRIKETEICMPSLVSTSKLEVETMSTTRYWLGFGWILG